MANRENIAALAIARHNNCGLTLRNICSGNEFRALCDDPGAPDDVRRDQCDCRSEARAVIDALDADSSATSPVKEKP